MWAPSDPRPHDGIEHPEKVTQEGLNAIIVKIKGLTSVFTTGYWWIKHNPQLCFLWSELHLNLTRYAVSSLLQALLSSS